MLTFIIMWGNYITLGNVLSPLFGPQFTPSGISLIGVIFVMAGAIGCFIMGYFIDKTQKHLFAIRFITVALTLFYIIGSFGLLQIGVLGLTCAFAFFAGIFNVPILPSSYSFATKLTSPAAPAVVNGLMMSGA